MSVLHEKRCQIDRAVEGEMCKKRENDEDSHYLFENI